MLMKRTGNNKTLKIVGHRKSTLIKRTVRFNEFKFCVMDRQRFFEVYRKFSF